MDPSSKKGLCVDSIETSKAYKVNILQQRKVVISRDVKLEEDFPSKKCYELIQVTKDKEQEAPKVESLSPNIPIVYRSEQQSSKETLAPSTSIRRP